MKFNQLLVGIFSLTALTASSVVKPPIASAADMHVSDTHPPQSNLLLIEIPQFAQPSSLTLTSRNASLHTPPFLISQGKIPSRSCNAKDNLDETARSFIDRCRKATVRREFPAQFYNYTLRAVQKSKEPGSSKAWKLLSDNRQGFTKKR